MNNKLLENLSTIEIAQIIRKRPQMFFGENVKLTLLANLLWGFNTNSQKESDVPFQYFNHWTKIKLKKFGQSNNWALAILACCENDEEKAFWKFYELLDEFTGLTPKQLFIAELTPENLDFYYSLNNTHKQYRIIGVENRYIVDPAPYHVKLFEFNYCVHSYHFDYYWVVGEYEKCTYYNHFESINKCQQIYKDQFNITKWITVDQNLILNSYQETINNCRNRRQNVI